MRLLSDPSHRDWTCRCAIPGRSRSISGTAKDSTFRTAASCWPRATAFPVQAFRYGSGYALQFHPDVTHATICRWTTRGHDRMQMPNAKPRAAHFADRAVYDPAGPRLARGLHQSLAGTEGGLIAPRARHRWPCQSSRSAFFLHSSHGRADAESMDSLLVSASSLLMKVIGPPMVMRRQLLARIDLGVVGAEHRVRQRRADDGVAVAAHQHHGGVLAEHLGQRLAEIRA